MIAGELLLCRAQATPVSVHGLIALCALACILKDSQILEATLNELSNTLGKLTAELDRQYCSCEHFYQHSSITFDSWWCAIIRLAGGRTCPCHSSILPTSTVCDILLAEEHRLSGESTSWCMNDLKSIVDSNCLVLIAGHWCK